MVANTKSDIIINIETRTDCPNCSEELRTISTIQLKPSLHSTCKTIENTIIEVPEPQIEPSEEQNETSEEPVEPSKKNSAFWWCRLLCFLTLIQIYLCFLGLLIFGIILGGFWRYLSIFLFFGHILLGAFNEHDSGCVLYCFIGRSIKKYWKAENRIQMFKEEF